LPLLPGIAFAGLPVGAGASFRLNGAAYAAPDDVPALPSGPLGVVDARFRPTLSGSLGSVRASFEVEQKTVHASKGAGAFGRSQGGGSALGSGRSQRLWKLAWTHHDSDQTLAATRIERLDLAGTLGPADWDLGRQPVSLGTSHFFSVLDVIAPFAPGALDSTYKPGVDAARARVGLGDSGEAELIGAAALPWGTAAAVGRLRSSIGGMDIELLGGRFRRRVFGGLGFEGDAGPVGVWGEAAFFERRGESFRGGWKKAAFSGTLGTEISPVPNTRVSASFLYQDFGVRRSAELLSAAADDPFAEGWAFFASQAYVSISLHRKLHPLVDADLTSTLNLVDWSALWQPRFSISLSDNAQAVLFCWAGTGPGYAPPLLPGLPPTPGSEFGILPTGGGLYLSWYL